MSLCYRCRVPSPSAWLCPKCLSFTRALLTDAVVMVREGSDAAFDKAFAASPCDRLARPSDGAIGVVEVIATDGFLPPHVRINGDQGALVDWVVVLARAPKQWAIAARIPK